MTNLIEVTSARHGRTEPVHGGYRTPNGIRSLCGVGAHGLVPTRIDGHDVPFAPREKGWLMHCSRCDQIAKTKSAA